MQILQIIKITKIKKNYEKLVKKSAKKNKLDGTTITNTRQELPVGAEKVVYF
jgi:hypothetical protein